jgi:hypothetical protein
VGRKRRWAARAGKKGREREGLESFFLFFSTILQLFKLLKFKLLFKLFKIQTIFQNFQINLKAFKASHQQTKNLMHSNHDAQALIAPKLLK